MRKRSGIRQEKQSGKEVWIHAEEKRKPDRKNRERTEAEAFQEEQGLSEA